MRQIFLVLITIAVTPVMGQSSEPNLEEYPKLIEKLATDIGEIG